MNDDIYFFHISNSKSLSCPSSSELNDLIIKASSKIISTLDDEVGAEINKYFSSIIPNNNDNPIKIITSLSEKYIKAYPYTQTQLIASMNSILNNINSFYLDFSAKNTRDIAIALSSAFTKSKLSKCKIKTFQDLTIKVNDTITKGINITHHYLKNEEEFHKRSFASSSTGEHTRNPTYSNNVQVNTVMNSKNEKITCVLYSNDNDAYDYIPNSKKVTKEKLPLPEEIIILLNKIYPGQQMTFYLTNQCEQLKLESLIILFNLSWLFPQVNNICFNMNNVYLQEKFDKIFLYKARKLSSITRNTKYDFNYNKNKDIRNNWIVGSSLLSSEMTLHDDINIRKKHRFGTVAIPTALGNDITSMFSGFNISFSSESKPSTNSNKSNDSKENESFSYFIQKDTTPYELIIIYSYFISSLQSLHSLSIDVPDCYSKETEISLMSKYKCQLINYHFLTFYSKCTQLRELNVQFNSLDPKTFEKITALIFNNQNLKALRLNLFSEDNNYSPSSLLKLFSCNGFSIKVVKGRNNFNPSSHKNEFDSELISRLIPYFMDNLSTLFYIIYNHAQQLNELSITFELPTLIENNDEIILTLMKFIFNLLIFLVYAEHKLTTFKLIAPFMKVDNRILPFIDEVLDEIVFDNDTQNQNAKTNPLKDFELEFQMYKIINIGNLLSVNFTTLYLGDLDCETFSHFMIAFTNETFIKNTQLEVIKIGLNNNAVLYSDIESDVEMFFMCNIPSLVKQELRSSCSFKKEDEIKKIYDIIYFKNNVSNVVFVVGKGNKEMCYYFSEKMMNKEMNEKKKFGNVIALKYNKLNEKNIFNKISEFLVGNKRNCYNENKKGGIVCDGVLY